MSNVEKALATQLENIQARTGKSLDELFALIRSSGVSKHSQIRDMLKEQLGMGHGDANTTTHLFLKDAEGGPSAETGADPLVGIYTGGKAHLRPLHEVVIARIESFGPFEVAPKKAYVSLRRKRQFATVGPATKSAIQIGLNMRDVEAGDRLVAEPPGRMCQYRVRISEPAEIDAELLRWIRTAYDSAR